jgi:hypothetical protein
MTQSTTSTTGSTSPKACRTSGPQAVIASPPKIRFCFPKTDDMLMEAGRRLQKLAR